MRCATACSFPGTTVDSDHSPVLSAFLQLLVPNSPPQMNVSVVSPAERNKAEANTGTLAPAATNGGENGCSKQNIQPIAMQYQRLWPINTATQGKLLKDHKSLAPVFYFVSLTSSALFKIHDNHDNESGSYRRRSSLCIIVHSAAAIVNSAAIFVESASGF